MTGKNISDYVHALNIWNKFEMKTMKYHYDFHLKCDVLLLAELVKLELITGPDMSQFFEKGARGGISYISNRYSKDNNKY